MQLDLGMSYALVLGMNANPVSSLAAIFVVMLSTGQYSDRHSSAVKSFATRDAAERFRSSMEGTVRRLEGIKEAIDNLLSVWQEANPRPDYCNEDISQTERNAWYDRESAERTRLEEATGFSKAMEEEKMSSYHDISYTCYYIEEVPFEG